MAQIDNLNTKKKFKKTELGEIPVDWEVVRLGEIISLNYGDGLPEAKRDGNQYPVYGSNGIIGYHNRYLVKGPGIIIGRKGTIGSVTWSDTNFWPIDTTYYVSNSNKTALVWLYYRLLTLSLNKLNMATGIPGLNRDIVLSEKIAIPIMSEQKRIAEILMSVDDAFEKKEQIIQKTKQLKKALMQTLLTRGICHKKFKKTELGEIPVDWEVVRLGEKCEIVGGSTPSTENENYWGGDIFWAVPTDITKLKGNIISKTERTITKKGLERSGIRILPKGSVLLTSRATIGECAINEVPMATNQGFASLICGSGLNNWFIMYLLQFKKNDIQKFGSGSTFCEVSKSSLRNMKLTIPKILEQKRIAEILMSVDNEIEEQEKHKQKLDSLKKALMQVLLTGKVRVRI